MPTKIQWGCISNQHLDEPFYCNDSPIDVFSKLYQTHRILSYKTCYNPAEERIWSGLHIEQVEAPKGTIIIAKFSDFEPEFDKAKLWPSKIAQITEQTYLQALRNAVERLGPDHDELLREGPQYRLNNGYRYETYVIPILEVASVTLGLKNPADLEKILKGE
ncbi:MAG: hypothetical protein V1734_02395 [Nanoarchaeota archaeon]